MILLAFDIETSGLDPHIDKLLLTSFVLTNDANLSDKQEVVFEGMNVSQDFLTLLESPEVLKIAHNASFDIKWLKHLFGIEIVNVWDTLACERLLVAGKSLDCKLDDVSLRRLGVKLDKSVRKGIIETGIISKKEKEYCLQDSRVLIGIYTQQKKELENNKQLYAAKIECELSRVVADIELNGIGFDKELWYKYESQIKEKLNELQLKIWDSMGCSYTVDIFGDITGGVPLSSRDKTLHALKKIGIELNDYASNTLIEYMLQNVDKEGISEKIAVIKAINEYKQYEKALSWSYIKEVNPVTNRIHCSFNPQGANTFRFTSSNPNMQQVTKPFGDINFRHLFRAKEGYSIVGADYSQIELRILAELTQEKDLLDSFNLGLDLHTLAAESVLGRPLKNKSERNLGKAINFGLSYGGGHGALMNSAIGYDMLIPEKEAKKYVAILKEKRSKTERWAKKVETEMLRKGYIQTPIGHRRYLEGENRGTVARNTTDQMLAAGIMKEAMVNVYNCLLVNYPDAHIILQVHDELVIECKDENAEEIKTMLCKKMEDSGKRWIKTVPITAEAYISKTWEK